MNKILICLLLSGLISPLFSQKPFKVIAYITGGSPIEEVPFSKLTHLNYSFAIPAKSGDTLLPLANVAYIRELIQKAHQHKVKVFLSIGGWGIGDALGDDSRFHRLAETAAGRQAFIESTMRAVTTFGFDGVDLDWEYPDPNHRSADDYVALCRDLSARLKTHDKQLTAAVVSAGPQAYGIKKEAFAYLDWLNLMIYDGDYGPKEIVHHSPYSMAVSCLDFWLNERQLPAEKAVLGLPFYAKQGHGNYGYGYRELLEKGGSPYDDYFKGHFYNGKFTIENKVKLALTRHLAGVMVWELRLDAPGEHSLFEVIDRTVKQKQR